MSGHETNPISGSAVTRQLLSSHPAGIRGGRLLGRMRQRITDMGGPIVRARALRGDPLLRSGVEVLAGSPHIARHVILAPRVVDPLPPIPGAKAAILAGQLRLCPVSDAYEAADKPVVVVGAASKALFLSRYSRQVTLLTIGAPLQQPTDNRSRLTRAGVAIDELLDVTWELSGPGVMLIRPGVPPLRVGAVWSSLGAAAQAGLATRIGVVPTDDHQQATAQGLFAASCIHSILRSAARRVQDRPTAPVRHGGGR